MQWNLLRGQQDWDAYTATLHGDGWLATEVAKGEPRAYPCLAAHCPLGKKKLAWAHVYQPDAVALLRSPAPASLLPTASPPPQPAAPQPLPERPPATWAAHCEYTAANLAAIIWFLVNTGICKNEAQYQEHFSQFLGLARDCSRFDPAGLFSLLAQAEGRDDGS